MSKGLDLIKRIAARGNKTIKLDLKPIHDKAYIAAINSDVEDDIHTPVMASTILDDDYINNTHTYKIYKGLWLFRWFLCPWKDITAKWAWFGHIWNHEFADHGYKSYGFRLLGLEVEILKNRETHGYDCNCGWLPPEEMYKTEYSGDEVYPKEEGRISSAYASFEFGINGHDWQEVHFCPLCKEEFEFSNSSY